jgi:hypothetical protein
LGAKPKRAAVSRLARALWDDLPLDGRDRLLADLRTLGFGSLDPFEAVVDFTEVTVLKRRNALKKQRKSAKKTGGKASP